MKKTFLLLAVVLTSSAAAYAQGSEFFLYAQRHSQVDHSNGQTKSGYTGGISLVLAGDMGSWSERELLPGKFALGWETHDYVGFGTFNSSFALDLTTDIFGISGRYRIDNDNMVKVVYDPVDLNFVPVGGYFGSRIGLKYSYRQFLFTAERGGFGVFSGFLSPGLNKNLLHSVSAQYQPEKSSWFAGARYQHVSDNSNSGNSLMAFFGFGM